MRPRALLREPARPAHRSDRADAARDRDPRPRPAVARSRRHHARGGARGGQCGARPPCGPGLRHHGRHAAARDSRGRSNPGGAQPDRGRRGHRHPRAGRGHRQGRAGAAGVEHREECRRISHPGRHRAGASQRQGARPVSYTHLDVYKRQVHGRRARASRCADRRPAK